MLACLIGCFDWWVDLVRSKFQLLRQEQPQRQLPLLPMPKSQLQHRPDWAKNFEVHGKEKTIISVSVSCSSWAKRNLRFRMPLTGYDNPLQTSSWLLMSRCETCFRDALSWDARLRSPGASLRCDAPMPFGSCTKPCIGAWPAWPRPASFASWPR